MHPGASSATQTPPTVSGLMVFFLLLLLLLLDLLAPHPSPCPDAAMLEPCNHKEFCMDCAVHCERCPLCRTDIAGRLQLDEAGNVVQGAGTSDDLGVEPLAESIPEFEGPA